MNILYIVHKLLLRSQAPFQRHPAWAKTSIPAMREISSGSAGKSNPSKHGKEFDSPGSVQIVVQRNWNLQQVLLNLFFKQPSILTQVNQISPKSSTPRESLVKPSSSPEMVGPWSEVPKGLWRRTGRLAPFWRTTGCGRCFNPPWMICGAKMGIYIHDVHVYTYVYARPNTHTFIHIYIYMYI